MRLIMKWIVCVIVFFFAAGVFPHVVMTGGQALPVFAAATALWLVNLLLRPVVQLVSLPITLLTFGLFSLVINALMVSLADAMIPGITITRFWACIFIALCISVGNVLLRPKSHAEE